MANIFVFGANGEQVALGEAPKKPEQALVITFSKPVFSAYLVDLLITFFNQEERYDAFGLTNVDSGTAKKLSDIGFDQAPNDVWYLPTLYAAGLLQIQWDDAFK